MGRRPGDVWCRLHLADQEVSGVQEERTWFVESCESVVSRLHPLCVGNLGRVFDQSKEGLSVQDLFAPVLFVMDLSSLKYEPAKNLLSQILLKQLFQEA